MRANSWAKGIGYGIAGGGPRGSVNTRKFDWKAPVAGRIVAAGYTPRHVELPVGGSLVWRVKGPTEHNVRFANGPRLIRTVSLENGETASRHFPVPGRYELFCSLHPVTMHQIVDVR